MVYATGVLFTMCLGLIAWIVSQAKTIGKLNTEVDMAKRQLQQYIESQEKYDEIQNEPSSTSISDAIDSM